MSEQLLRYITDHRRQLADEGEKLRKRLAEIEVELQTLDRAEASITAQKKTTDSPEVDKVKQKYKIKRGTIMASVLEILEKNPNGMIALDLLYSINQDYWRGEPLMRTSLSPQLSRLRQAGFITLKDSVWKIANTDWRQSYETEAVDHDRGDEQSTASDRQPQAHDREAGSGGGT